MGKFNKGLYIVLGVFVVIILIGVVAAQTL